jgi:outer membrane protein assembly factor BamD (BamD/ComL family)
MLPQRPGILEEAAATTGKYESLVLQAGNWEKPEASAPGTPRGDLQLAEDLFRREEYARAAQAFEKVADTHEDDAAVHETALFLKAEAEFQQGKYARARDSYEALIKAYPGGSHLSEAVQRLFVIADGWLEEARADVRRGSPGAFPGRFIELDPGRQPLFDKDGHAIHTLDYVRQHDPNGPLADDSLMMSAGYHFSQGDFRQSELLSEQLIQAYPRSEHQALAHLLSAESKLHSYKGPSYDGKKLEEARRTLRAALSQYPNELEPERQRVYRELDEIRQAQAKSQFEIAEWYRRQGRPKSARVYYEWLVRQQDFAGTKWAEQARERLDELDRASPADQLSRPASHDQTAPADPRAGAPKG